MYKNFIESISSALLSITPFTVNAQFAHAVGQPGTTVIHADSLVIVAWAAANDTWPTPFCLSGFDLDAADVIHDVEHGGDTMSGNSSMAFSVYPNAVSDRLVVNVDQDVDL